MTDDWRRRVKESDVETGIDVELRREILFVSEICNSSWNSGCNILVWSLRYIYLVSKEVLMKMEDLEVSDYMKHRALIWVVVLAGRSTLEWGAMKRSYLSRSICQWHCVTCQTEFRRDQPRKPPNSAVWLRFTTDEVILTKMHMVSHLSVVYSSRRHAIALQKYTFCLYFSEVSGLRPPCCCDLDFRRECFRQIRLRIRPNVIHLRGGSLDFSHVIHFDSSSSVFWANYFANG